MKEEDHKKETWYCARCSPPQNKKDGKDHHFKLMTVTTNHEVYQKAWYTGSDWDAGKWRIGKVRFWKLGNEE